MRLTTYNKRSDEVADGHYYILKRVVKERGESRSRFTENETVLSQLTNNKLKT